MNKVHVGEHLVVGEVTITAMERVERYRTSGKKGFVFYFSKKPVRVTVDSPEGSWDFDLEDWNSEAAVVVDFDDE